MPYLPGSPVRTRFAPSPTGRIHLGGGRTALYDYLLAQQTGGQFILRIEDTDQKRSIPGAEEELMANLRWLGLVWDEGPDVGGPHAPYRQSERKDIYRYYAEQLVQMDRAYYCFCSPERLAGLRQNQQRHKEPPRYDGLCRRIDPQEAESRVVAGEAHVIRFKTPQEGSITVRDLIRGDITVENRNIDDYILIKSDGLAVYHLAAMVDDHLMEITHVIRGSEWLPTFPLHAHILRSFSWEEPVFVHLSIFLKPSGKGKMSKRDSAEMIRDGFSIYLADLRSLGYLPEAVVNWTALMGWSYDDRTEYFTLPELVEKISLDRLNPSPAAINFSKLDHFNGLHIRSLAVSDLAKRLKPFFTAAGYDVDDEKLLMITPIIQERITTLEDAPSVAGFFFEDEVNPNLEDLVPKGMTPAGAAAAGRRALRILEDLPEISRDSGDEQLRQLAVELGLSAGQVFAFLRSAVTGRKVSPPLFETLAVIGKKTVLARIHQAIEQLEQAAGAANVG
ncbi:MAG TPA: glutamate--tRNA ligase [Anaerolineales bacterium]|nr:glutamate--tRNA ligase [Anaerolineales bacterium]